MPEGRMPTVIIPYKWPISEPSHQDVFVYLRPETNGVRVESLLLRTVRDNPYYDENITLAYLANVPGDFIERNRVIEEHYRDRIYFTLKGKEGFTPYMRRRFEEFFHADFAAARIIGPFEAMRREGWTSEQLFELHVEEEDLCVICAQTIKRVDDLYIINYDIPGILHKNHARTDVAVMIFRSNLESPGFQTLIEDIRDRLVEGEVLSPQTPLSHALHYSKSPFEQILDASGYLYEPDGSHCPFDTIRYSRWLIEHELPERAIRGVLRHPIFSFLEPEGERVEEHIFVYTSGDSYEAAHQKLGRAVAQVLLR